MKKIKIFKKLLDKNRLLYILFLAAILLIVMYNNAVNNPLKSKESVMEIKVDQGEGFYDVLNDLDNKGQLSNKFFIKVKMSRDKKKINLKEGIYKVDTNVTLSELIEALQNDDNNINMVKVTIPEGYDVDEIAEMLEEKGFCGKEEFLKAVNNYELPTFIEVNSKRRYNLEGFLYPDTYFIKKGTNANDIISMMLKRFEKTLSDIEEENNITIKDKDIYQLITIASMIEKEAGVDEDRSLISSVIYNRLEKNMKLQLDATVLYALGYHVDVVLNRHLEVDSPYNTYKYTGLPIGPIGSPGKDSIKAALLPVESNYLYYILQKDGSHYFTDKYEDFLAKKKELGY